MTTLPNNPGDLRGLQHSLTERLDAFGRLVRLRLLLESAAWWVANVIGFALLTFVLDHTLRLSHFTRRGLLIAFLAACGVQAWRILLAPLRLRLKPMLLASALERKTGRPVAARVATVLELPGLAAPETSRPMIENAVMRSHQFLNGVDFNAHVDPQRRKNALRAIATMLISSLVVMVIFHGTARLWAARLFAGSDEAWPQRTMLQVAGMTDGRMTVPRGESFSLRVSAREGTVPPDTISIRWQAGGAPPAALLLTKFGANDFRYDFPPVQTDATVQLAGGDDAIGPFLIHPVDRPRVVDLKLTTQHPTESQPRAHNFTGDDSADLAFLPHTAMELSFTANIPIAEARVTSATTQPSAGAVRRINDRQFALSWEHSAATQLQIELISQDARLASAPTSVSIGLKTDKPPRATLGFTGVRPRISPQATIPLVAEARDDFGVDRVALQLKADLTDPNDPTRTTSISTTQPIFGPATQPAGIAETEVRQTHPFKVADLKFEPGHVLTFTVTATDRAYPQPQTGASRQVIFRVVRAEELFKEILLRQQAERAKLRKQLEEARKLRDELGVPLTPEDVPVLARQHRAIQRELTRIQISLSDSLTEMRLNVLGNADTHEMMDKSIIQPMKTADSELLTPQRDALDTLAASDAPSVSSAIQRQDQIIARLDAILKQMAQWDSFIDVLNQLNEIIRVETLLQKDTSALKQKQTEGIFDP